MATSTSIFFLQQLWLLVVEITWCHLSNPPIVLLSLVSVLAFPTIFYSPLACFTPAYLLSLKSGFTSWRKLCWTSFTPRASVLSSCSHGPLPSVLWSPTYAFLLTGLWTHKRSQLDLNPPNTSQNPGTKEKLIKHQRNEWMDSQWI